MFPAGAGQAVHRRWGWVGEVGSTGPWRALRLTCQRAPGEAWSQDVKGDGGLFQGECVWRGGTGVDGSGEEKLCV